MLTPTPVPTPVVLLTVTEDESPAWMTQSFDSAMSGRSSSPRPPPSPRLGSPKVPPRSSSLHAMKSRFYTDVADGASPMLDKRSQSLTDAPSLGNDATVKEMGVLYSRVFFC